MDRGSCPDFYKEYGVAENVQESWVSTFNRANKLNQNCSNTITLAEVRGKPHIDGIFDRRGNGSYENAVDSVQHNRTIMCNGHDILSLTYESVKNMSLSDAHETLFQLRVEGNLMKKGFKRLKLWKLRYFVLSGRMLTYWEVNNHNKLRHQAEITADCRIMLESISNRPYAFSVLPSRTDRLYILDGVTQEDRDMWIHCIQVCKFLVQRELSRPALRGVGSVYDHFSLGPVLGKGRYGYVRLAECNNNSKNYAVKIINRKKVNREVLKHELVVLRAIKQRVYHENLVTINEIYADDYLIHIVMEYLGGGDLYERINKNGAFSVLEVEAARVIRHIGRALLALHEHNIYHLDVKPENVIYISKEPFSDMKLADFGCCMVTDFPDNNLNEIVGSPGYIAPEVITSCKYSDKCDVYSLGVLLYILLVGYPPYKGHDTHSILEDTINGTFDYSGHGWMNVSTQAIDLVTAMVEKNPSRRISMTDVLRSDWIIHPPQNDKHMNVTRMPQTLQMSFPSTLPGSKLYTNDDWHSPRRDSDVYSTESDSERRIVANHNAIAYPQEERIPSLGSFEPIPKSVPYDLQIV